MPATTENPPFVRFGAVYFRKTNPPPEDWARDYAVAREDGHTLFRHWVAWNVVETAPGRFDWSDFDRQLDLAAENGIRTILAEFCIDTPEWLHAAYPHARREGWNGAKFRSDMHGSCVSGGHFAMCLDNPEVAEAAGRYLREMATRYRGHPGLMGYDIWNECTYYNRDRICYCPATQAKFRLWLERKYGTLDALNAAWKRFSYTAWDQVELPREAKLFPEVLDAVAFQNDNAFALMQWRIDQIRSVDDSCVISAHGNAKTHADAAPACGDDWRAGELVDLFGYTFWYGNDCDPVFGGDMTRSAARGREFWRAEAVGDHDWLSRRRGDARAARQDDMHDPDNIRLDCLISLMTGARAFQNPRWRPLLDGPFFGAFGWYGMDGSRTERSEMIRGLAEWANTPDNAALWRSRPIRGEVAVLLLDEAQAHCYAMHGDTAFYSLSVQGACEAFLDAGVQADVIKPDQIDDHAIVYVPYALSLSEATLARLRDWVSKGGTLIAEAGFGYFDDRAHAFPVQPSRGLGEMFGARERAVHFGADRWASLDVATDRGALPGGLHRQSYLSEGGTASGHHADGSVAIVDHAFGAGRTRLVGTMPGYGYKTRPSEAGRDWFRSLVAFGGGRQRVSHDAMGVVARLSDHGEERFLWVVNRLPETRTVTLDLSGCDLSAPVHAKRGAGPVSRQGSTLVLTVPGRDAAILGWTR